jgi:hypothetical protein
MATAPSVEHSWRSDGLRPAQRIAPPIGRRRLAPLVAQTAKGIQAWHLLPRPKLLAWGNLCPEHHIWLQNDPLEQYALRRELEEDRT